MLACIKYNIYFLILNFILRIISHLLREIYTITIYLQAANHCRYR